LPCFNCLEKFLFPFLIGTVRTREFHFCDVPARDLFPFLIGTVRTSIPSEELNVVTTFPFLIGTVRTLQTVRGFLIITRFPFLIGTVRTDENVKKSKALQTVSIPHRYGKNLQLLHTLLKQELRVSIPHRYGKNVD